MGDHLGLVVMLVVAVLLVALLFVMRPRRRADEDAAHESLNPDVGSADARARLAPKGAQEDRLVGNPPVDTVTRSGSGTAVPGEGAGGPVGDSHDPLRSSPNDVAGSPDQG